jgi:excisionase family DNA binding protein
MPQSELLNLRQTADYLSVSTEEVAKLYQEGKISAYQIGGSFLRFKRQEILDFRENFLKARYEQELALKQGQSASASAQVATLTPRWGDGLREFWYFKGFYIYSGVAIVGLLYIIFR